MRKPAQRTLQADAPSEGVLGDNQHPTTLRYSYTTSLNTSHGQRRAAGLPVPFVTRHKRVLILKTRKTSDDPVKSRRVSSVASVRRACTVEPQRRDKSGIGKSVQGDLACGGGKMQRRVFARTRSFDLLTVLLSFPLPAQRSALQLETPSVSYKRQVTFNASTLGTMQKE